MNFIDKAFASNLRGDDFLQAMDNCGINNEADILRVYETPRVQIEDLCEGYISLCEVENIIKIS